MGGIDAWDNFLVYTAGSKPVITLALTNTVVASGQAASFRALAEGPGAISYAWFTNGAAVAGAASYTCALPAVSAACTNIMVVAGNLKGFTTNAATVTVVVPTVAVVTNLPADGRADDGGDFERAGSCDGRRCAGDHVLLWNE